MTSGPVGLGQIVATPSALSEGARIAGATGIASDDFPALTRAAQPVTRGMIDRHASKDWGDLSDDDKAANESALLDGSQLLSAYVIGGAKFYVITEAAGDDGSRPVTTLLLASEY